MKNNKFTEGVITKYQFIRLPKPYETNCIDYENSTRFECLNKCYFEEYIKRFGCIPNSESLYTVIIKNELGFKFCSPILQPIISQFNKNVTKFCDKMCGDSCIHYSLDLDFQETGPSLNLYKSYTFS